MRQFTAAISGMSSGELQGVLRELRAAAASEIDASASAAPPSRRRPRRPDVVTYRVRVDLQGARPPLWRRLELSSDLLLDEVHQGRGLAQLARQLRSELQMRLGGAGRQRQCRGQLVRGKRADQLGKSSVRSGCASGGALAVAPELLP